VTGGDGWWTSRMFLLRALRRRQNRIARTLPRSNKKPTTTTGTMIFTRRPFLLVLSSGLSVLGQKAGVRGTTVAGLGFSTMGASLNWLMV